jgi:rhodanese-related sulfurtransferase
MSSLSFPPAVPVVPAAQVADDAVLVDVREQDEWDAGHAPNAVHIPMGELTARVAELPESNGPLPIVCRSGNRSGRVAVWLNQHGVDAVNVGGGMQAWDASSKPMVSATAGAPRVI